MKGRPRDDVMVMTTPEARRQLKIIAAVTGSTMKDVLTRLVSEEFKRVTPVAHRSKALVILAAVALLIGMYMSAVKR
jgi:hypothetical protein